MAARRLLIVLLILLGISTLAAVLAPPPDEKTDTKPVTTQVAPPPIEQIGADNGRLLKATIDADDEKVTVVPLRVGDQLALQVRSKVSDQVEIPAFGQIEATSRDGPANFDLLLEEKGSYDVKLVDAGRVVGRLEVSAARPGKGSGKGTDPPAQP
jgi:hypothetical protein